MGCAQRGYCCTASVLSVGCVEIVVVDNDPNSPGEWRSAPVMSATQLRPPRHRWSSRSAVACRVQSQYAVTCFYAHMIEHDERASR